MPRYQIQTRLANDEWECTEEFPTIFNSYLEAFDELQEFCDDCKYAVDSGFLEDFNPEDWRLFEIMENDTLENVIWFLADAFALLENHQDAKEVRDAMTLMDKALQILEKKNVGQH
jgi:hypothetical protein